MLTMKLNILIVPNGAGQPNSSQLPIWKRKLEDEMGLSVSLSTEMGRKRRTFGGGKKRRKPNNIQFDLVVSSFPDWDRTTAELNSLSLQTASADSVIVTGEKFWKYVVSTKTVSTHDWKQFQLSPPPPPTTTTTPTTATTTTTTTTTTPTPNTGEQKAVYDQIKVTEVPALAMPQFIQQYPIDPQAQYILDRAEDLYNQTGNFHHMLMFPCSWYIHFPKFCCLPPDQFAHEWRHIAGLPAATRQLNRGDRHSSDEHHHKQFQTRSGNGGYTYSGLDNPAVAIEAGGAADQFLRFANALMCKGDAPNHDCQCYSVKQSGDGQKHRCPPHNHKQLEAYNGVLKNWYTPASYIMAHADDETGHAIGTPIFSFSAGASRTFRISKHSDVQVRNTRILQSHFRGGAQRPITIELNDGDLLIMGGHMQQTHKHEILKLQHGESGGGNRINWTVRAFREECLFKSMHTCSSKSSSS